MNNIQQIESYNSKPTSYYGNPRLDYLDALPMSATAKILEIGCGNGATGLLALKRGLCKQYVGIEMFEPMAERAAEVLSNVHLGSVETINLDYAPQTFDVLIASEVLEHLIDPSATLRRIMPLLKPGALVFASSPNISWYGNIVSLMKGHFDYEESGMMDRTHLRWFTPSTFKSMFEDADVVVDHLGPVGKLSRKTIILNKVFGDRFEHLSWFQINLHGHRNVRAG